MPPTQALNPLGWKVRKLETQAHVDLRTTALQKNPSPPNPQTQNHQATKKQEHNKTTILSRLNAIVLRGEMPDIFILLSYGTLDIFNMIEWWNARYVDMWGLIFLILRDVFFRFLLCGYISAHLFKRIKKRQNMVNNDHKLSKHRSKMNPGGLRGLLRPSSGLKALPRPDFMRFLSRFELILGTKKRLTITSFFENVCLCASPEGFLRAPGLHFERFWLMFGDCWVILFRPSDLVIFSTPVER